MCLAKGHKALTPVRLKPTAPWSRVKHSTTEPLLWSGSKLFAKVIWRQNKKQFARKFRLIRFFISVVKTGLPGLYKHQAEDSVLLKDTTKCLWWGSNPQPLNLKSSTLPLSTSLSEDFFVWFDSLCASDASEARTPQSQVKHSTTELLF